MIIFPAVDIHKGNAVRLRMGRKEESTIFSTDPVQVALHWQEQGARRLHVVDLDGAFEGQTSNYDLIGRICEALDIPVQVGGGIRSISAAESYIRVGVSRLIIGTMALEEPDLFAALCSMFPYKIGVSLDAENGMLKTRGWEAHTDLTVADVLPWIEGSGASFIVYTDIERDGMQAGFNLEALEKLLRSTKLPVIAAGGASTMEDVRKIAGLRRYSNLEGLISGRALYEKTLDLAEAQTCLDELCG